jgi:hypothetical protein
MPRVAKARHPCGEPLARLDWHVGIVEPLAFRHYLVAAVKSPGVSTWSTCSICTTAASTIASRSGGISVRTAGQKAAGSGLAYGCVLAGPAFSLTTPESSARTASAQTTASKPAMRAAEPGSTFLLHGVRRCPTACLGARSASLGRGRWLRPRNAARRSHCMVMQGWAAVMTSAFAAHRATGYVTDARLHGRALLETRGRRSDPAATQVTRRVSRRRDERFEGGTAGSPAARGRGGCSGCSRLAGTIDRRSSSRVRCPSRRRPPDQCAGRTRWPCPAARPATTLLPLRSEAPLLP